MESGVYQRFNRAIEKIFDNAEEVDVTAEIGQMALATILLSHFEIKIVGSSWYYYY